MYLVIFTWIESKSIAKKINFYQKIKSTKAKSHHYLQHVDLAQQEIIFLNAKKQIDQHKNQET
jgi:hypothetical protein